ncbi:hypothetical protein V8G54_031628 [Vigna mungo]|uniref:Uncharacterized protein n=1 Tax=Vigna mungo TaxID=3915 RepID=A0AAQ3MKG3_VIGMU
MLYGRHFGKNMEYYEDLLFLAETHDSHSTAAPVLQPRRTWTSPYMVAKNQILFSLAPHGSPQTQAFLGFLSTFISLSGASATLNVSGKEVYADTVAGNPMSIDISGR